MIKLIIHLLLFSLVFLNNLQEVCAQRYVKYIFKDGLIKQKNQFIKTNNPVNKVSVLGFISLDKEREQVGESLWKRETITSESDNIILEYPKDLKSKFGYVIYFFKENYIPWEQCPDYCGTDKSDPSGPNLIFLSKKYCDQENNISNIRIKIFKNSLFIIFNISSCLEKSGPLKKIHLQLLEHYITILNLKLTVCEINNRILYQQDKIIKMKYGEKIDVEIEVNFDYHENFLYKINANLSSKDKKFILFTPQNKEFVFSINNKVATISELK